MREHRLAYIVTHNAIILINCRISMPWYLEVYKDQSDVVDYIFNKGPRYNYFAMVCLNTLSVSRPGMYNIIKLQSRVPSPCLINKRQHSSIVFTVSWRLNPLGFPRLALSSHSCRDIMCTENNTICFLYIYSFLYYWDLICKEVLECRW